MTSMVTFTFYEEMQIAGCPSSLDELKQTVKKLYCLSDTQISNCLLSYIKNNKHYYILTEEDYQKVKLIIESVVIKIELSDEYKYVTKDPLIDEEYDILKLDKKEKKQISGLYEEKECIKKEKHDNHQHKEQVDISNDRNSGRRNNNYNKPYNPYQNPNFGPRGDDNRNLRYQNNKPNNNRYPRGPYYQNSRQHQNYKNNYYQNYNNNYNYNKYPEQNYENSNENNEEKEKLEDENKFRDKYESFVEKIESVFYGQVSKDDIINIVKSLINMPSLTIFEAMNLIYRQVKIYNALEYYKSKADKSVSLDGDIFENRYPDEYPTLSLNKVIESYKINKCDKSNDTKENPYYLYVDENVDMRRKISKNKDGIYNYLPITLTKNLKINEEDSKRFQQLEIFAKNEYEVNYHPLFYKTIMCNSCIKNEDEDYLIKPLCPYSHDIQNEFRIIYDYKDKSICKLMKVLSASDLFNFESYLKYIPLEMNVKEKKDLLQAFKVHKCQLDKSCPNDYHLCPFYHESKKEQKRRPPFLFRYSSEMCEYCFNKVKNKYIVENCPYGDFCNCIHSKNEYNYHIEHFGQLFKCTRKSNNGKCPFRKTCYGIHKDNNIENDEEEEESDDEIIDEEKLEDKEINDKKEKIEKIIKVSKIFRCRKCNYMKNCICIFMDCEHFLCLSCLKKLKKSFKKLKRENEKEKNENNKLKCPFCGKDLDKEKLIKYEFSKVKN